MIFEVGPQSIPLPLAFRNNAINLIETAIGAWRPMFDDIATDFAGSTTLASLGGSTLHGPMGAFI